MKNNMSIKIVFMGTPEFASQILKRIYEDRVTSDYHIAACVTQPDKPSGRKMRLTASPVKQMAVEYEIPVLQPVSVRTESFCNDLLAIAPDIVITAAYGKILPLRILDIPKYGCLNVHGSLLPRYRGAAPVQWAIINGEKRSGVTIIKMDPGMDTGDILSKRSIEIEQEMNAEDLMDKLGNLGAELLSETLPGYIRGEIVPVAQCEEEASKAPLIMREQACIDWGKSAGQVNNLIRGMIIWPGAFTFYKEQRLKIYQAEPAMNFLELIDEFTNRYGAPLPGTILRTSDGTLDVLCGENTVLKIQNLQLQSSKRMMARDCAHNYMIGEMLGLEVTG